MLKVSRIFKDYRESGALCALISVHAAIDDHTFLTKRGQLLVALRMNGPDSDCWEGSNIDQIARRFESAARILEGCRVLQYRLKRSNPVIPARAYDNPIVQEAINGRWEYLKRKGDRLCTFATYIVIVDETWKPNTPNPLIDLINAPAAALREALSPRRKIRALSDGLGQAREALLHKVKSFIIQLPDAIHADLLDKGHAFLFFRELLNYAPYKAEAVRLKQDRFVDFQACDSGLDCYPDHLRLDGFYVRVLTLKEPPAHTFANILQALEKLPVDFTITTDWKRESGAKVRSLINAKRRHFHNSKSSIANYVSGDTPSNSGNVLIDESAAGLVTELGACLQEIELNGHAFGEFSLTIVLYGEDDAKVRQAVAECFKVFAVHDGRLTEERYNLLNAWIAVQPGNAIYNLRRLWILDTNYADLSFLFTPYTGEKENPHLGAEYLAVFETDDGTPFFFNLHYQDVASAVLFGATGSGKSYLVNFLLTHLQKYQPFTYIFDLGHSYENLTKLFNGAYLPIGIEQCPFTINPFVLQPTAENLHFLFLFLKVLIESGTYRMAADDEADLSTQIENLYAVAPDQRRLSTLADMLKRGLRVQLHKWVKGGPYEAVFDNVTDNLTFAAFQTFVFDGMTKTPQVLEALLFYILHRANATVSDPSRLATFKIFVIDEAWRFFQHPVIQAFIVEMLKTGRKKNVATILATQSSADLLQSGILPHVVESCPTKMFLANPGMDRNAYREMFHLNDTEVDLIARLIPKQQILIKRPDIAKVVNLQVSSKDYWLYTSNPYERQRRDEVFSKYGFKEGLEILARSNA